MAAAVLILEDSEVVRAQILDALTAEPLFERYLHARDGVEGIEIMKSFPVDLILCDVMMPRMDGFEFLSWMKEQPEYVDTPVIILSGIGDPVHKIKGLGIGASDYVTKPFDNGELLARIRVQLRIKALQDEMRHTNKLLEEISVTDHLTHLYNRRYLMKALENEVQRAARKQGNLSLVIMDLDHFKSINDSYGHQCGDMVLSAVAETIQVELRRYDIAARYGGEEFAVVLPDTALSPGIEVAERLRGAIAEIRFPAPMEALVVTVSQGVASFSAAVENSVDLLIKAADDALYRAKHNGRNRVEAHLSGTTGDAAVSFASTV